MNFWHGYGWWMWIMMGVFWIFVVALIVFAMIWLSGSTLGGRPRPPSPPREESPEEILKRRCARGEIDAEEYRHRLEELRR